MCPYCASPSIVQRPPAPNRPKPTFLVGFVVDHEHATRLVRQWMASRHFFVRSDFKTAVPELTRGVYLPAYLYGAVANSDYSASIGENYTETETYTTTDANGKTVTRTRTVVKTEWRPLSGQHCCYVVDVIVSASKGVTNPALEAIEPFDLRAMRRFEESFISGWLAEEASRTKDDCFRMAHDESVAKVGNYLKNFMPGDTYSNLQYRTSLSHEVIDLVLLPVWSYAVRYAEDKPPVQILVNGQTGRIGGDVPISATKVGCSIAVVVGIILAIVIFFLVVSQG